ncbi:3-hydroxyacyl-CoA dehydrogenase NAD-binding domain-containing protein [Thalassovita mangrovi]|uniref:3-hydroxyacyl-CoA dehydrogenase n=1 Tax=Thalassovita mangrovi TaxID=2692236 RepID=A0A6L8LJJ0_9RHOB|nr:3-hydroxyacyl-CoA dehydrogenase NAD-binding domain-containing protein [Thalassovita mangrovi]MYM54650.1 hypothetical protein [Thalassovita mangrovi]
MAKLIEVDHRDGVAVLTLDNGPANLLSRDLRAALIDRIGDCNADPSVIAIVLRGAGAGFSTGVDFADLETPPEAPTLSDLCRVVEDSGKPVVAALHGRVLGGGLELALAAHARVADRASLLGFPSFAMGLLPEAGATQLLPRLIGAGLSLDLIRAPRLVPVEAEGLEALSDRIVSGGAEEAAETLARDLAAHPERLRRSRDRRDGFADPAAFQAAISRARHDLDGQDRPPDTRLIDCVEASLIMPFDAGLAFEEAAVEDCRDAPYSKGLRHAYQAIHRAPNFPERLQAGSHRIAALGVVGGGPSGTAIAAQAAAAGHKVILFERSTEALREARSRIAAVLDALNPREGAETVLDRQVDLTTDLTRLASAGMVIEAVAENPKTKAQVFAALDQVVGEDAILATNSALLPIADIAMVTTHPERVIGLHFHTAPASAPLAEVIPGLQNDPATIVTTADFATGLGRTVLRCGTGGGTLGEAMLCALRAAAWFAVEQGASPYAVDRALIRFGLPNGVFRALDRLGLDVALKRLELLHDHAAYPTGFRAPLQNLVDAGRTGLRAGAGFYGWDEHLGDHEDPDIAAILGLEPSRGAAPSERQIELICIAAMANQGAKLLRSGAALRPSDIDAAMILGHGFPRPRGGPMKAADMAGLFTVLQELRRLTDAAPDIFDPEPGIAALVRNGEEFDVLNRLGRNRRTIPE